ncbi:MAG: MBL fold metallo-hydrolase [Balneolaceae bacterium]|nr:MBL fold metallo-hydrolase [Balneolaceae bacterium]
MELKKFEVGPFLENTYLLNKGEENLLIDPGFSRESEYKVFRETMNGELLAVVLTHAHVDHVQGLSRVLQDYDVPVYLNEEDRFLWENYGSQAKMFGINDGGFNFTPEPLPSDGSFTIGSFTFECLYTPGHSPDHNSLYFKETQCVIAGDALFKESIGRTDLYKGSLPLLEKSIREKLYSLSEKTTVYPGHGPLTTIGHEKTHNPFVKA